MQNISEKVENRGGMLEIPAVLKNPEESLERKWEKKYPRNARHIESPSESFQVSKEPSKILSLKDFSQEEKKKKRWEREENQRPKTYFSLFLFDTSEKTKKFLKVRKVQEISCRIFISHKEIFQIDKPRNVRLRISRQPSRIIKNISFRGFCFVLFWCLHFVCFLGNMQSSVSARERIAKESWKNRGRTLRIAPRNPVTILSSFAVSFLIRCSDSMPIDRWSSGNLDGSMGRSVSVVVGVQSWKSRDDPSRRQRAAVEWSQANPQFPSLAFECVTPAWLDCIIFPKPFPPPAAALG